MEKLLWLQISVITAVLLVLFLRQIMRRVPKIYSYLLWLVVFARLLCPVSFESRVAVMPSPQVQTETVMVHFGTEASHVAETMGAGEESIAENPSKTAVISETHWKEVGWGLWFLGTMSILSYNIAAFWQLKRRVRGAYCLEGNVYVSSQVTTPFTMGLLHPCIYLPEGIEEKEQDYILCHERVHIRRKDYLVKNIAFLLTALYWWNPFVWVAFYFMEQDMEMSCDEAVMRQLDGNFRREYAQSLLNFATGERRKFVTPLTFGGGSVRKRVKNILSGKNGKKRMGAVGIVVLLLAVLLIFTTRESVDTPNTDNKEEIIEAQSEALEETASEEIASEEPAVKTTEFLETVQKWATAFCGRNGHVILDMIGDNEELAADLEERLLLDCQYGSFGWSSPWPWGEEYQIVNMAEESAEILYYALTSEPHVTVWRETLKLEKQKDGTLAVIDEKLEYLDAIVTAEEFYRAYPGGIIAGTPMEYETKELYAASLLSSSMLYSELKEPDTAARYLLNILDNKNKVTMETEQQEDDVKVTFHFLEDGSTAEVMMTQFQGEYGDGRVIWMPKTDTASAKVQDTGTAEKWVGIVNAEALLVRLQPTEDAEVISLLAQEKKVYILGEQDDFYKISILSENGEELEGYVKKEYVEIEGYVNKEYLDTEKTN